LTTSPRTAAVLPVVDYEPPPLAPMGAEPCSPPSPASLHRLTTRPPRGQAGHHPGAEPPVFREIATFADAALRRVLEVIDRRRPVAQLRPLLAGGLVDSLLSLRSAQGREGTATLRSLRVQVAAGSPPEAAAEVSATYSRGRRIHAIACRVEQVRLPAGARWEVVALHIG
jgi:Family of unknown function (DUF6459)